MTVSLFIPCTVDIMLPEVGEATFRLLSRLGEKPLYHPEQTCCGQPLFNAGYRDEAKGRPDTSSRSSKMTNVW